MRYRVVMVAVAVALCSLTPCLLAGESVVLTPNRYYWRCSAHGDAWSPVQELTLQAVKRPTPTRP